MSEHDDQPAKRPPAARASLPTGRAWTALRAHCPGCGRPSEEDVPCAGCGHTHRVARWTSERREKRSVLAATFGSSAGEHALLGLLFLVGAAVMFRVGRFESKRLTIAAVAVVLSAVPLLGTGAHKAFRVATRRRWRYESPDGVRCVADGTPRALTWIVRARPLGTRRPRAPEELGVLDARHARALAERPELLSSLRFVGRPPLEDTIRARVEACIAVSLTLARMELAGSARIARTDVLRTAGSPDRRPTEDGRVVFTASVTTASDGDPLAAWIAGALSTAASESGSAVDRESSSTGEAPSSEPDPDLAWAVWRRLRTEPREGISGLRAMAQRGGDWHATAPSLTTESSRWLAELAGCVWDAFRAEEFSDDDWRWA
jgi:hypothetical protein